MKRPSTSAAVLVSGGLDSAVLLGLVAMGRVKRIWPLYIRQGLRWETVELYWLRRFLKVLASAFPGRLQPLTVLSVPMTDVYGPHWSVSGSRGPAARVPGARTPDAAVYLPGRNMLLTLKAAVFCAQRGIQSLSLGPLNHNPFPDATPAFFTQWSKALSLGLQTPIHIAAPLRTMAKRELVELGQLFPLHLTFSCLSPVGKAHCGRCNKCAERQKAFRLARIEDRTPYAR